MQFFLFNRISFLILSIVLINSLCLCGNKQDKTQQNNKLQQLDLSKYGKNFTLLAPDTINRKLIIEEQNYMLQISVGNKFRISIEEGINDLNQLKLDKKADEVNKFKRYLTQEPNLLVWESEITCAEFHFCALVTVGTSKYLIKDFISMNADLFNEQEIHEMLSAVKSIKEK
jgi:hypothetical protein